MSNNLTLKKKLNTAVELTEGDVKILNSKIGLRQLVRSSKVNLNRALTYARYDVDLRQMQAEMIKLQSWVEKNKKKVVIIYEGRDAAGKGGAIRRTAAHINPRAYRVIALPKPTTEEAGQWYFQRYVSDYLYQAKLCFLTVVGTIELLLSQSMVFALKSNTTSSWKT